MNDHDAHGNGVGEGKSDDQTDADSKGGGSQGLAVHSSIEVLSVDRPETIVVDGNVPVGQYSRHGADQSGNQIVEHKISLCVWLGGHEIDQMHKQVLLFRNRKTALCLCLDPGQQLARCLVARILHDF